MKTYSLRRSALITFIAPLLLIIVVTMGAASWFSYREISTLYDTRMIQLAETLQLLTKHEAMEGENLDSSLGVNAKTISTLYQTMTAYRIWSHGVVVTATPNTKNLSNTPAVSGFSTRRIEGEHWRIFALTDPDNEITVEVAERSTIRSELVMQILHSLSIPLLLLIPTILFIIANGISRALQPLDRLSHEVNQRHASDLHPLEDRVIPREIAPVFLALNQLLSRLDNTIKREREFTDNAAHELRTPLAAIKTQAQVLEKHLPPHPRTTEGLRALLATINRATATIEQMLSFARLQNQALTFEEVDLSETVRKVLADLAPVALAKEQELEADLGDGLTITGHAGALAMLVRNLIDNAIRYTPSGGKITATLESLEKNSIRLRITDTGSGIPANEHDRIFERFTRIDTTQTGSGLGLSIVKWVCDLHKASIRLDANVPHGLVTTVTFSPIL